jgi:hypothetical protein
VRPTNHCVLAGQSKGHEPRTRSSPYRQGVPLRLHQRKLPAAWYDSMGNSRNELPRVSRRLGGQAATQPIIRTGGGDQEPSSPCRVGSYTRSVRLKAPFGAGSQLTSLSVGRVADITMVIEPS